MTLDLVTREDGADVVVQPPLAQAVGYVVVVVIGLVIAFGNLKARNIYIRRH